MALADRTFDFVLDTVSAPHDVNAILSLLKTDGKSVFYAHSITLLTCTYIIIAMK